MVYIFIQAKSFGSLLACKTTERENVAGMIRVSLRSSDGVLSTTEGLESQTPAGQSRDTGHPQDIQEERSNRQSLINCIQLYQRHYRVNPLK